jgi:hypothetical protein
MATKKTNADDVATTGVRRNFTFCFYFPRYSLPHLFVVNIFSSKLYPQAFGGYPALS